MEILIQNHVGFFYNELTFNNPNLIKEASITVKVKDAHEVKSAIIEKMNILHGNMDYLAYELSDNGILEDGKEWYKVKVTYVLEDDFYETDRRRNVMLYSDDDDY